MIKLFFLAFIPFTLTAQETEIIKKTDIYSSISPSKNNPVGELLPGAKVTKLKKDKTGKFIKATIEVYIPIESLKEKRISLSSGVDQIADNSRYRLIKATRINNRVEILLKVTNISQTRKLDFSAMALLKVIGKGSNRGELNPFEGKYQDLEILKPNQTITAKLVYDFKSIPENVELICSGKMGGNKVYYQLGF